MSSAIASWGLEGIGFGSSVVRKAKPTARPGVPAALRHETVTVLRTGIDGKGLSYITSIVSVFLLGAIAWPKDGEPAWYVPVLIGGIATSILGMGFRYKAHLDQQRELREAKAEASRANRHGPKRATN